MTISFDEKGKFFTNVVSKSAIPAVIQTLTHRIQGNVHVRQGQRIKDELDESTQFLAVTNAEVFDGRGLKIYDCDFLVVNRDHVVWLIPHESLYGDEEEDTEMVGKP